MRKTNNSVFQIEVIHEKTLRREIQNQLAQWFKNEFSHIHLKWATPQWYILALNGSDLIGRLGIVDRKILVGGQWLQVGGVSGVIIRNELRENGIGRIMMIEAVKAIRNKLNTSFGLLLCRKEVS